MILEYPTIYKDSRGIETSQFISDGQSLKITLRGVTFEGYFWGLILIDDPIDFGTNTYRKFNFIMDGKNIQSKRQSFEYGLTPENTQTLGISHIKCCINCQFGEYSPFGNQEYGDMMCFRKCKEDWLKIGYIGLKHQDGWKKSKTVSPQPKKPGGATNSN